MDASWADNSDDRRSTCGFLFKFGGRPVFWKIRSSIHHSNIDD
jgi:hypothetical protein